MCVDNTTIFGIATMEKATIYPLHGNLIRGVGGVLEVVRPKVGAAEGCFGGGPGDLPREIFVKKDTKSCVLGTSGTVYKVIELFHGQKRRAWTCTDAWQIYESRKRSKSDAHMHRWILIFLLRFCTFRTDHTFGKVVRPWSYQSQRVLRPC